jgi:Methyltransferase domain
MSSFAHSLFLRVLRAWGEGDLSTALLLAKDVATTEPEHIVYREAAVYLERVQREGKQNVYVSPEGFGAFIRGGGNIGLYSNTSDLLRDVYEEYASFSLLDVGVGDGLALLPALIENVHQLDVIEPSTAMLANMHGELQARNMKHRTFNGTLQDHIQQSPFGEMRWDVAQATYSLQSIHPSERPAMLQWLGQHTQRLLIAEFDAPDFDGDLFDNERVRYFIERYKKGLAEYDEANVASNGEGVKQGFLMPVFFGGFDLSAARTNWEMPIDNWVELLKDAGFTKVETKLIYPYWWAKAYLIDAQ